MICCALLAGCTNEQHDPGTGNEPRDTSTSYNQWSEPEPPFSRFITTDSANKMVTSYLKSIPAADSSKSLRYVVFDADSLRSYLSDTSITQLKVMFSHTLAFINAGNEGKYAGYRTGALTFILAAYDRAGNYVYKQGNRVLEHSMPCPTNCVKAGTASGNLLQ